MPEKWNNDKELKEAATRFFTTAISSRRTSFEEVTALLDNLIERNCGFKLINGSAFANNTEIRQPLNILIQRCLKLLGTKIGHEQALEELAWEHAATATSEDAAVKAFITALGSMNTVSFSYVAPNYAVRFGNGVRNITIGPVRACLAEDVAIEINERNQNPRWSIIVGANPGTKYQNNNTIFELPTVCWDVDIVAARGKVVEESLWFINIALSLLRLFYPLSHRQPPFPAISDYESVPTMQPEIRNMELTLSSKGAEFGGQLPLNQYIVDQEVIQHLNTVGFYDYAKHIFDPPNKSVATRIAQGL